MLSLVRRRMRAKGSDPKRASQEPVEGALEPNSETAGAKRMLYLVTLPHPKPGGALVAPGSMSRLDIAHKFLQACAQPASTAQNRQPQAVVLDRAAIFHELHKENADGQAHSHYHIAVKGMNSFRFAPVKKALQDNSKLASHWSCTHNGYWSPIRYCAVPSPAKPRSSLDPQPLLWSRLGLHPLCTWRATNHKQLRRCGPSGSARKTMLLQLPSRIPV